MKAAARATPRCLRPRPESKGPGLDRMNVEPGPNLLFVQLVDENVCHGC